MSVVKNFIITFCVSVLIFGLLAYFIVNFATETILPTGDPPSQTGGAAETLAPAVTTGQSGTIETDAEGNLIFYEINSESFTVLLLGTDYQPDTLFDYDLSILNAREKTDAFPYRERIVSADAVVLLHIDREHKQFVICSIPGSARVSCDGVPQSLSALYDSKGARFLADKVTAMTGLAIDYFAAINVNDFATIIDDIGGVTVDVPCSMYYEDASQGLIISLERGLANLTGDKALQLLRFNGYEDGVTTRALTAANFAKALLDKLTNAEYLSQALTFYQKWKPMIETDFTESDLTAHIDIIFAYPSFSPLELTYPGDYRVSENGDIYFDPDATSAYALFAPYKNVE